MLNKAVWNEMNRRHIATANQERKDKVIRELRDALANMLHATGQGKHVCEVRFVEDAAAAIDTADEELTKRR
jgi:hypothetical protein